MHVLPEELRETLRTPLDTLVDENGLFQQIDETQRVVSVGDRVTFTLLNHGFIPVVCIVDFIIERKDYSSDMEKRIRGFPGRHVAVKNPPGVISDELWEVIAASYQHILREPVCIEVDGEEDLATLPAIYLAPQDVTVIYGLPNKGVVLVPATDANKRKVQAILDKMGDTHGDRDSVQGK